MLLTSLLHLSTLFGGGWGGIWVEEGFKLTLLFEKHCLKLAVYVRKTKSKMGRAFQHIFSMIVALPPRADLYYTSEEDMSSYSKLILVN